jgi:hypothetical protein
MSKHQETLSGFLSGMVGAFTYAYWVGDVSLIEFVGVVLGVFVLFVVVDGVLLSDNCEAIES